MRESIVVICPTGQASTRAALWRDGQIRHGWHARVARRAKSIGRGRDVTCFTEKASGRDDTPVRTRSDGGAPCLNPSTAGHRVYHDMQADPPDLSLYGASHDPALKRKLRFRASDIGRPRPDAGDIFNSGLRL